MQSLPLEAWDTHLAASHLNYRGKKRLTSTVIFSKKRIGNVIQPNLISA